MEHDTSAGMQPASLAHQPHGTPTITQSMRPQSTEPPLSTPETTPPPAISPHNLNEISSKLAFAEVGLDEVIYEACHEVASQKVNNGEYDGDDFWAGHEQLHCEADDLASEINEEGLARQIEFLAEGCRSKDELLSLLRDWVPESLL